MKTVKAVVKALGGPTKAASSLALRPNVVGNWKLRGRIPPEHFLAVTDLLRGSGGIVEPSVFGMRQL